MNEHNEKNKKLLYEYFSSFNQETYDELYINNINLVHTYIRNNIYIPNKTKNQIDEEYSSIGFIALHDAIRTFDISKIEEVAFSTYAVTCIRNAILKQLKKDVLNEKKTIYYEDEVVSKFDGKKVTVKDILIDDNDVISQYEDESYALYKKQKIIKVVEKLSQPDRDIIKEYFGLDGSVRLNKKEIIDRYGLTDSRFRGIVSKAYQYLREELKEFKNGYEGIVATSESVQNIDLKIKKAKIRTLYIKYGKEKVIEAINNLESNIRNVIGLYYGLDGNEPKSAIEISKLLNLDYVYVNNMVHKNINKVIKINNEPRKKVGSTRTKKDGKLKSLYIKYGKQSVLEAINQVDDRGRTLLYMFYGLNGHKAMDAKKLAEIYNSDDKHIYSIMHHYQRKIERMLEVEKTVNENKIIIENIFPNRDIKDVIRAILRLSEKDQNMIRWYLISSDSEEKIMQIIDKIECELIDVEEEKLSKNELMKRRQERFYKSIISEDKRLIKKNLEDLDDKEREIITLYFGLDGKNVSNISSINKGNYNIRKRINGIIKKINLNLMNKKQNRQ